MSKPVSPVTVYPWGTHVSLGLLEGNGLRASCHARLRQTLLRCLAPKAILAGDAWFVIFLSRMVSFILVCMHVRKGETWNLASVSLSFFMCILPPLHKSPCYASTIWFLVIDRASDFPQNSPCILCKLGVQTSTWVEFGCCLIPHIREIQILALAQLGYEPHYKLYILSVHLGTLLVILQIKRKKIFMNIYLVLSIWIYI